MLWTTFCGVCCLSLVSGVNVLNVRLVLSKPCEDTHCLFGTVLVHTVTMQSRNPAFSNIISITLNQRHELSKWYCIGASRISWIWGNLM